MKKIIMTLIVLGAFSWSNAVAQTKEQEHKHEQHEEVEQVPPNKGMTMKDEMKEKMSKKMKDMKCCPKEDQREPKS